MKPVIITQAAAGAIAALACTGFAPAGEPGGDRLWDNGLSFVNGLSQLAEPRRSILDDFVVDDGWAVTGLFTLYAWGNGLRGIGKDFQLVFYDGADGQPDFDSVAGVATNRTYYSEPDYNNYNFFGLSPEFIWVEFDRVILDPGTYWVDMHIVGPVNGYQVVGEYPQHRGEPVWVDYEDFGGRQPGRNVFGDDYDVFFRVYGERIPAPGAIGLLALAALGRRRRRGPPTCTSER